MAVMPRIWCHIDSPEYDEKAKERLMLKVRHLDNGCWEFLGNLSEDGYGRIGYRDGITSAHRLSYELHVGEIPEGLVIDHLCCFPSCVNPEHMEPVAHLINAQRGNVAILNENAVRDIRANVTPLVEEYAEKYGVAIKTVWNIVSGKSWKNVS